MRQYDIDEYSYGTEEKYPVTDPYIPIHILYVYAHLIYNKGGTTAEWGKV